MNVHVSDNLKQSFFAVKQKQIISLKELFTLQKKVSIDTKWMIYVGYLMDMLLFIGLALIVNLVMNKLKFDVSIIIKLLIAEVILQIYKLCFRLSSTYDLYKVLKETGIKINEIEKIRLLNANKSFQAYNLMRITKLFYSKKTHVEVFESIVADWQVEYFEALFKKESWKARWINVRYTYAFLVAMWQKSPLGDLIEFIRKIAK